MVFLVAVIIGAPCVRSLYVATVPDVFDSLILTFFSFLFFVFCFF